MPCLIGNHHGCSVIPVSHPDAACSEWTTPGRGCNKDGRGCNKELGPASNSLQANRVAACGVTRASIGTTSPRVWLVVNRFLARRVRGNDLEGRLAG